MRSKRKEATQLVGIFDQLRPVADGRHQISTKDKVEFGGVNPVLLDVIDFELDIGWNKVRLDGTDIVAQDLETMSTC